MGNPDRNPGGARKGIRSLYSLLPMCGRLRPSHSIPPPALMDSDSRDSDVSSPRVGFLGSTCVLWTLTDLGLDSAFQVFPGQREGSY